MLCCNNEPIAFSTYAPQIRAHAGSVPPMTVSIKVCGINSIAGIIWRCFFFDIKPILVAAARMAPLALSLPIPCELLVATVSTIATSTFSHLLTSCWLLPPLARLEVNANRQAAEQGRAITPALPADRILVGQTGHFKQYARTCRIGSPSQEWGRVTRKNWPIKTAAGRLVSGFRKRPEAAPRHLNLGDCDQDHERPEIRVFDNSY